MKKSDIVQVYDPNRKKWVKVNKITKKIIAYKTTKGCYVDVPKSKISIKFRKQKKKERKTTHKLVYKKRKLVGDIITEYSKGNKKRFKPNGKPDKIPTKIKDVGKPNLRTQLVFLKCKRLDNLPTIHSADAAADILGGLSKNDREVMQVMYLNNKNKVIGIETAHKGSVNMSIASPHEIMKTALLTNATAIIVAHNHPSGVPTPSPEDISFSKKIRDSGKLLGIELLDSIIIGKNKYYSLKQEGKL